MSQPFLIAVNSVTFRGKTPEEIVPLLVDSGVASIEWAGDAHAPPGDRGAAEATRELCAAHGIEICSYGSYYQCDTLGAGNGPFAGNATADATLRSAHALGAPAVRVWGGRVASAEATPEYRAEVAECLKSFCDRAAEQDLTVHLEFHRNTLTDTAASAKALMDAVGSPILYSYWQPRHGVSEQECLKDIAALGKRLSHVHVFNWRLIEGGGGKVERLPLALAKEKWIRCLSAIADPAIERRAMIEFVKDDSLAQYREDLAALREIVAGI